MKSLFFLFFAKDFSKKLLNKWNFEDINSSQSNFFLNILIIIKKKKKKIFQQKEKLN
jgi:hypothetical protein